ncbi:MAG: phosphate ABC transporter permease subunit PstC [Gemmatimonadaceae bacterium]
MPTLHESPTGDRVYRILTTACAASIPALLIVLAAEIGIAAWPALRTFGLDFATGTEWDAVRGVFGVAPAIFGTVLSSALALLIAAPLALGIAVFTSEIAPAWLRSVLEFLLDLLAAIPSVIYGLWGLFVLVPWLRETVMPLLADGLHLGETPLFSGPAYGPSMLAAGLLLAIMVLPYIAAVAREVLAAVPDSQREAALALGATRWEVVRHAVLPYARSGIIGAVILGLGRALGETMAVTMVIGNRHELSASLFAPGYTLASLIANEFAEATADLHLSALMAAGATLLAVTLAVNAMARWLVWRVRHAGSA